MDEKVCLDTDACIAIVNKKGQHQHILNRILNSSACIYTISVFELFLRKTKIEEIENFINDMDIKLLDF